MGGSVQKMYQPFEAQQQILRQQLDSLLAALHPLLRIDVERAFHEPGKLLAGHSPIVGGERKSSLPVGIWSLLTLLIAQAVDSDIDLAYAARVAIAMECFICALDLLDDAEGEDHTAIVRELGIARTLNVSTTLLALAQRSLLITSPNDIMTRERTRLLTLMQEATLTAAAGQHLDLLNEQKSALQMTQSECLEFAHCSSTPSLSDRPIIFALLFPPRVWYALEESVLIFLSRSAEVV